MRDETGATMLMSVFVLITMTIVGIAAMLAANRMLTGTVVVRSRAEGIHAADAGAEYVRWRLAQALVTSSPETYERDIGPDLSFSALLSTVEFTGEVSIRRTITSVGDSGAGTRTVRVTMDRTIDAFRLPMYARGRIDMNGRGKVDWYDSRTGPYNGTPSAPHFGNLRSDGPIDLRGGAQIFGDAIPGPGFTTTICNNCQVTGSTTPATTTIAFPQPDVSEVEAANDNAQICAGATCSTGSVWVPGLKTLIVTGGAQVTLRSGTYNLCKLAMSGGGSRITIDPASGPVRIFLSAPTTAPCNTPLPQQDPIDIGGGNWSFPAAQRAADFQVYVRGSTTSVTRVTLKSGSNFLGAVYAPESDVTIQANADLFGGFVGKTLNVTGGGSIHYDKALAGSGAAGTPWVRTLWLEL